MTPIAYAALPKPTARRNISTVAWITADFDAIAVTLKARPKAFSSKPTRGAPDERYRSIFLRLSNGAYAVLTEWDHEPGQIDLDLEVHDHEFVYENEYGEVIAELRVDQQRVRRLQGNLTWLASRKAKKVPRQEPQLPEDWWNHVKVVPLDKR